MRHLSQAAPQGAEEGDNEPHKLKHEDIFLTAEDRKLGLGPGLCVLGMYLRITIPAALDACIRPPQCLSQGIATVDLITFILN